MFIRSAFTSTDGRINNNKRVTPAYLFSALLWYPLQEKIKHIRENNHITPQDAFFAAYSDVMSEQQRSISIPKRFQAVMKDIWILQEKFSRREGKRAFKSLEHPKFRAAYDFLLLRAEIEADNEEHPLAKLAKWWTDFQNAGPDTQSQMVKSVGRGGSGSRRSPRKRRKPRQSKASAE